MPDGIWLGGRVGLQPRRRVRRDHGEQARYGSEANQLRAAQLAVRQMRLNLAALLMLDRAQHVDAE
jgi:hypothetical protein